MLVHLLPNIAGTILIAFTFGVAGAILAESGLSFLGFGVQPPTASWGGMLRTAFSDPLSYWHLTLFPGLMLFWAVAGFNFLGEGLRKALDPRHS
ncbi:Glutathione transport system permease protein GsiD [bioreactor metagenome]|uniref:Glutathione transport system permease protein GsiD n=1 Tax=bioreactor metagenome TaxID=1076179 RepID=A0A645II59_9ZZZZ